jgi:hypothetical protein
MRSRNPRSKRSGTSREGRFLTRLGQAGFRLTLAALLAALGSAGPAAGGPYRDSAHGDAARGVNRAAIDPKYQGYAVGNCAHCHEMHASLAGAEPQPAGGPAPRLLYAANFNTSRTLNPYVESDNFCFSCHSDDAGQRVRNPDYSAAFGGAADGSGPQSILAAFNQASYHNLYDLWNFARNNPAFGWFKPSSNPCSACHNPHLAKRNADRLKPGFPLLSAVSKPGDYGALWGESQLMSSYVSYEAPFALQQTREPGGVGEPNGEKTPDYVGFCASCHSPDQLLWSTTLGRNLTKLNWGSTGEQRDKHGSLARDGAAQLREPYAAASAFKSNFVLSCLDCHEPHGSDNLMLLRRRMNGESLEGTVSSAVEVGYACKRCHKDDLAAAAGTGEANRWAFVHHDAPDAPYARTNCTDCHAGNEGSPIECLHCHGHGKDDTWAGARRTGRGTF